MDKTHWIELLIRGTVVTDSGGLKSINLLYADSSSSSALDPSLVERRVVDIMELEARPRPRGLRERVEVGRFL